MRKSAGSDYCGSLMDASKKVPGLSSVPVIAEPSAIQKPIAQNLTVQVLARDKRTPYPGGWLYQPCAKKLLIFNQS